MTGSLIGQKVGDYEIIARIGTGGMGAVFEAKHPVIGKRVAVKVLHPAFAQDPKVLERFVNEARVVNTIKHPGVVDIFSFGKTPGGTAYFLMEFLKGRSVGDLLAAEGAQSIGRSLDLIAQLFDVLAKAHAAGVVHRDLKPQNLFVEDGFRLRVLDFGIAKSLSPELRQALTGSAILGTPGYMAPEQINSEPVTPRTDLYAAGAVLFELLTGRPMLPGKNVGQMLIKALHEDAPRASTLKPDIPRELDDLVARLLAREPSGRPESAQVALELVQGMQRRLEAEGSRPTHGEMAAAGATSKHTPFVPGIDDQATGLAKVIKPKAELDAASLRTEPAMLAVPRPGSAPPRQADEESMRSGVPKRAKSNPVRAAPAMHEVAATAIDRQLVARMKDEASGAQAGGATKWVVLALLLAIGLAAAAWFIFKG
ncbi:MAG: serine/threonine protein kinase [Myxococcaceae bacterium]|nr:serine/threonine protein kinase [Myxococcaceae bacterium]